MKYEYFISYGFNCGVGNARIVLERKINKYEDVQEIEKMIKEDAGIKTKTKIIITNYKVLRKLGD